MRKWVIYNPNNEKFYFVFNTSIMWVEGSVKCSAWDDFDSLIDSVEAAYYDSSLGMNRANLKYCMAVPVDWSGWLSDDTEIDWHCGIPLKEVSTIGQI